MLLSSGRFLDRFLILARDYDLSLRAGREETVARQTFRRSAATTLSASKPCCDKNLLR